MDQVKIFTVGCGIPIPEFDFAFDNGETWPVLASLQSAGLPMLPSIYLRVADKALLGSTRSASTMDALQEAVSLIEVATHKHLGGIESPLFCEISAERPKGSRDRDKCIQLIGINDNNVSTLASLLGNESLAWKCYLDFMINFTCKVFGIQLKNFEESISCKNFDYTLYSHEPHLSVSHYRCACESFKTKFFNLLDIDFPQDPFEQLGMFVNYACESSVVFDHVNLNVGRQGTLAEPVTVFIRYMPIAKANLGGQRKLSLLSRNPATGEDELVTWQSSGPTSNDEINLGEISSHKRRLEKLFNGPVQIDIVADDFKVWLEWVSPFKKRFQPSAVVDVAVDLVDENIIDEATAVHLVDKEKLEVLLRDVLVPGNSEPIATGNGEMSGVAVGRVAYSPKRAALLADDGHPVVLVVQDVSRQDYRFIEHVGITGIVYCGGFTSHIAIMVRSLRRTAVRLSHIVFNHDERTAKIGESEIPEGDWISLDSNTGEIFLGRCELSRPIITGKLKRFLEWVGEYNPVNALVPSYTGAQKFAVVLGCDEDMSFLCEDLELLAANRCRVWHDRSGNKNPPKVDETAKMIERSSLVIVYLSATSVQSSKLRSELMYALELGKQCVPILLDNLDLPAGLERSLCGINYVHRFSRDYQDFIYHMVSVFKENEIC